MFLQFLFFLTEFWMYGIIEEKHSRVGNTNHLGLGLYQMTPRNEYAESCGDTSDQSLENVAKTVLDNMQSSAKSTSVCPSMTKYVA